MKEFLSNAPILLDILVILIGVIGFCWGTFANKWVSAKGIAVAYGLSTVAVAVGVVALTLNSVGAH